MCTKCYPVVSQYKDEFKLMKKQGTGLKKAKRLNPVPNRADLAHYHDLKIGFELMCLTPEEAISTVLNTCMAFGISKQRLAQQRKMTTIS